MAWGLVVRPERRTFASIVIVVLASDLVGTSYGYIPFVTPDTIYPTPVVFNYLREQTQGQYRMIPLDGTVPENFGMAYGVFSATGYEDVLARTRRLLKPAWSGAAKSTALLEDRRLDLMNVKYLLANVYGESAALLEKRPERYRLALADGSVRLFENLSVLPRAFLVPLSGAELLPSDESQLARLTEATFDPSKAVILPQMPSPTRSNLASGQIERESSIAAFDQGINDVRVVARVSEPSILVLSQAYYPGWLVTVNGEAQDLLRVDYGFSGVRLEEGYCVVRFSYEPQSVRLGAWVSGTAFLVTGLLFVVSAVSSRRQHRIKA